MEADGRQDEVFGCIPHGARAYLECTSLPWGLTPLYSAAYPTGREHAMIFLSARYVNSKHSLVEYD